MIRVQVYEGAGLKGTRKINRFVIEGHAGSGEYGKDVVCSAVSALAINFVNSVETLCNIKLQYEDRDGFLDIHVSYEEKVQWLGESLLVGLTGIADEYPQYMRIKFQTIS